MDQLKRKLELTEFDVYKMGVCYAAACSSLPKEELEERMNSENPTGIQSSWEIADEPFRTGHSNPCPCELSPETHKHWLFMMIVMD